VRAPEGHTYVWTENPSGINGYYLVSRGERTPWRLKLRTAGFNNVAVIPEPGGLATGAFLLGMMVLQRGRRRPGRAGHPMRDVQG